MVASHTPPTGDQASNLDTCPGWESNQQPCGSQADAQSTESHQPELSYDVFDSHTQNKVTKAKINK